MESAGSPASGHSTVSRSARVKRIYNVKEKNAGEDVSYCEDFSY